ncbi:ABC transporter substrate-binding protein [Rhodovastum atsumiense]|uniref:ABC transporter substrate-binding protein n=1 Tax=Rhodovastum atsumiense TaxID=504468 RepID=A0A5M6IXQ0_9PROT|nr:ABC transporter substrate-binding protein [Rhodovastum atsumiense]KAA5613126.1 ABC transporter substrate-binding protein [Rhodovastum atsumiense]CAH2600000.1 ABC transporter substrate-binding protein [Rhodovastum atsumiense]
MRLSRRVLLGSAAAAASLPGLRARAQGATLKIGVLTDLSGPYKDLAGPGAIESARLALADFGVSAKGMNVEVLSADHQNKADIGTNVARQWFDRDGVDIILECANSAVGLAVANVAKEKNKVYINSGAATSDLTGAQCNANTIHWVYDTYMLAKSTGGAMVKTGGDSWFIVAADYAFGHALQRDTTAFVEQAGGKVLGTVRYPFPGTSDFSSFLLQAQASGAKVLGLASAGADVINSIKQAKEFGISQRMRLAGLLIFLSDVHSLGLEVAQGLTLTESFYWDLNDGTRRFSDKFIRRLPGRRPTMVQAGVYSSTLHYLKVAQAMGVAQAKADGAATTAQLRATPTEDDCFGRGSIRPDGRKLHPAYLFEVKKPSESRGAWDYYKLLATTPADQAFRPLEAGACPLVRA